MIKIKSITLFFLLLPGAFASTFSDINRGQDKQPGVQRQEERPAETKSGEMTDEGELGTFRIQTQDDIDKGQEIEKKRQQKQEETNL